MTSMKDLILLVSTSIISISYAGFRKIIDLILIKSNRNGPKMYP